MTLNKAIKRYKTVDCIHLKEIEKYYKNLSQSDAISQATLGQSPKFNGKINMDSHQRRVGAKVCKAGLDELLRIDKINPIAKCKSFEDVFKITEQVRKKTFRLGDLWSYDTALRIGFNLGVYPKEVYVQAGVIRGVNKALKGKIQMKRSLPLATFPKMIQQLKPHEVENFLCIWGKGKKKNNC